MKKVLFVDLQSHLPKIFTCQDYLKPKLIKIGMGSLMLGLESALKQVSLGPVLSVLLCTVDRTAEHALGFVGRRTCSGVCGPQNMLWGLWAAAHALGFMGRRTCSGVYGPQNLLWGLWATKHALGFVGPSHMGSHLCAFFKKSHSMLCIFSFRHASIHVVYIICFCLSTLCIKQGMAVAYSDRKLTFCRLAHVMCVL